MKDKFYIGTRRVFILFRCEDEGIGERRELVMASQDHSRLEKCMEKYFIKDYAEVVNKACHFRTLIDRVRSSAFINWHFAKIENVWGDVISYEIMHVGFDFDYKKCSEDLEREEIERIRERLRNG